MTYPSIAIFMRRLIPQKLNNSSWVEFGSKTESKKNFLACCLASTIIDVLSHEIISESPFNFSCSFIGLILTTTLILSFSLNLSSFWVLLFIIRKNIILNLNHFQLKLTCWAYNISHAHAHINYICFIYYTHTQTD